VAGQMKILPKTTLGKWAVGLSIAFIILIGMKIADYIHFPLPTFAIAALGIIGLIIGLLAVFRNKDRAILNFLPILVGVVILLWTAAETIFPH
jgi:membrane associated rhomboid family serine protease